MKKKISITVEIDFNRRLVPDTETAIDAVSDMLDNMEEVAGFKVTHPETKT